MKADVFLALWLNRTELPTPGDYYPTTTAPQLWVPNRFQVVSAIIRPFVRGRSQSVFPTFWNNHNTRVTHEGKFVNYYFHPLQTKGFLARENLSLPQFEKFPCLWVRPSTPDLYKDSG